MHASMYQVQSALRAVSTDSRALSITLYLTGCKPEQLEPQADPAPGSTAELITALQASRALSSQEVSTQLVVHT